MNTQTPISEPRFTFGGICGVALYFENFTEALTYYTQVLGPPSYTEGEGTREWQLGKTALTLLKGKAGTPRNMELIITMPTVEDAEQLQAAFLVAGGTGEAPSTQCMGRMVHYCPVRDPFGTEILVISPLP